MNLVCVASESVPFAKTGGLADVVGALPRVLASLGHNVSLVLPDYPSCRIATQRTAGPTISVPIGERVVEAEVSWTEMEGPQFRVVFLKQKDFFEREGVYVDESGKDFPDNDERFAFLSRGALEAIHRLGWPVDCWHVHDWPTAMLPVYLKKDAHVRKQFPNAGCVLTIHNLVFQGWFPNERWDHTGLDDQLAGHDYLGQGEGFSMLRGGLLFADQLTTVSRRYAKEIQGEEFGCGMQTLIAKRRRSLTGIVNGIDYDEWNPATDRSLFANYDVGNWRDGKAANKSNVLEAFKLPSGDRVPLLAMVTRLTEQKGLDLIIRLFDRLKLFPCQFAILGTGDRQYQTQLEEIAAREPARLGVRFEFDDLLARRMYAGSDMFLMPSRFEPCGLSQLYSLRYGSVPIVRAVGGLDDTVVDAKPDALADGSATGVKFHRYRTTALASAIGRALELYHHADQWARLVESGMRQDWSWSRSAQSYVEVYEHAVSRAARGRRG